MDFNELLSLGVFVLIIVAIVLGFKHTGKGSGYGNNNKGGNNSNSNSSGNTSNTEQK